MTQLVTSPEKFAESFSMRVLGAYREVTAHDIRDMTECGLIGRYDFYGSQDLQTIIGILRYEQLREKRTRKEARVAIDEPPRCRSCGEPLPLGPEGKQGRPKEYCPQCEPLRATQRYKRWHSKSKPKQKPQHKLSLCTIH